MSNFKFYIKQNDTTPSLTASLTQDGSIVDLTDATVKFHMSDTVNAAAVVAGALTGVVRYDWVAADTVTKGSFPAEFEVTFPDGRIETFPNSGYGTVDIQAELA